MDKFRLLINNTSEEIEINKINFISSQDIPYYASVKRDLFSHIIVFDYLFNEESQEIIDSDGVIINFGKKTGKIYKCELKVPTDNKSIDNCRKTILNKNKDVRFLGNIKALFEIIKLIRLKILDS